MHWVLPVDALQCDYMHATHFEVRFVLWCMISTVTSANIVYIHSNSLKYIVHGTVYW
jgi:hypothetical protein